jgi:exodeoxyribonuclease-3
VRGVTVVNTYVPQGRDPESDKYAYKRRWLDRLEKWFARRIKPRVKLAWCGDINIAPEQMDVHAPKRLMGHVCFNPDMTDAMNRIRETGLVDVFRKHVPEGGQFTYFDYRGRGNVEGGRGWRVDHIHATKPLANRSTGAFIDVKPRLLERPSDHTPLVVDFSL